MGTPQIVIPAKVPERVSVLRRTGIQSLKNIRRELNKLKNKKRAKVSQSFFKTGSGQYSEGDQFLGIDVPTLRIISQKYRGLSAKDLLPLLRSPLHEERLLALLILVSQYERGTTSERKKVFQLYLGNKKHINNWDLVDLSSEKIVGPYLKDQPKTLLTSLAKSKSLWDRRIAVLATFHYIKQKEFQETLRLVKNLLQDQEDLMHKACGWMLREIGKRHKPTLVKFLNQHSPRMPRTMLRYAIERFSESQRQYYLKRI